MTRYKPTGLPPGRRRLPDDERLVTQTCRVRPAMKDAVRIAALDAGVSVQDWMRTAFEEKMRRDVDLAAAFDAAHVRPTPSQLPDWAREDDGVPLKWKEPPH